MVAAVERSLGASARVFQCKKDKRGWTNSTCKNEESSMIMSAQDKVEGNRVIGSYVTYGLTIQLHEMLSSWIPELDVTQHSQNLMSKENFFEKRKFKSKPYLTF